MSATRRIHIWPLWPARCYPPQQLDQAKLVAFLLQRGDFVYVEPPRNAAA
jgi:hypothetical protein